MQEAFLGLGSQKQLNSTKGWGLEESSDWLLRRVPLWQGLWALTRG